MNKGINNRFDYLKSYTLDGLLSEKSDVEEDFTYTMKAISEGDCSSEQKSEFLSDLRHYKEKLEYINFLISEMSGRCKTK